MEEISKISKKYCRQLAKFYLLQTQMLDRNIVDVLIWNSHSHWEGKDWDEERRVLGNLDVVRPEVRDEERQLHGEVQGGRRALGQ